MFHVHSPAQDLATALQNVSAPFSPAAAQDALPLQDIGNAPITTSTYMAGMPLYGSKLDITLLAIMPASDRLRVGADDIVYGDALNDPDRILMLSEEHAQAHALYRTLSQELREPGRYCIRRLDDGHFMLVHRPRGLLSPPLKGTAIEFSAKGWRLAVPEQARAAWNPLRLCHFRTLDALKAALPRGMKEGAGISVGQIESTHL